MKQHELVLGVVSREEERFRQTLARGLELLDGVLGTRRRHRRRRVLPARHARLPDRPHARDRGGARPHASTSTASTRAWQEQRTRAKEAHKAAGGKGDGAPLELYRELLDELGPTDFTGRQEYETEGAKVRALVGGRDRLAQAERRHRGRASCSTARRSTPSPVARSATPGSSRRPAARGCGSTTRSTACPAWCSTGAWSRRARSPRATRRSPASTAPAATRSAATTPRRTSCTGRCARCSART